MVTISFKTFDSFKKTIEEATLHPDRMKPDRFHVINPSGDIKKVAMLGMAGKVLLVYYPVNPNEIKFDDPFLQTSIEVSAIGENV
jgi:hypothetical protein